MKALTRAALSGALLVNAEILAGTPAIASDHLDTPSVIKDSRADIGDVYAWMSPDGRRLNLVMTIVGHSFSDHLAYTFHVDSARAVGGRNATLTISCMTTGDAFSCFTGKAVATGQIGDQRGADSPDGRLRAFAGLRDDPFFNNVRGTRDMYNAAIAALRSGARYDPAGCPMLTPAVAADLLRRWRSTNGGPGKNFLNGWTPASIVVSIDKRLVTAGGPLVSVWGTTGDSKGHIDRAARPLTGNALLATLGSEEESDALKEKYNRSTPADGDAFVAEIAKGVGLYDGLDGRCSDSLLAAKGRKDPQRYYPLARLLADDRLWIDSRYSRCTALFAVERAALNKETALRHDCGGRKLTYDASNIYRSLLISGKPEGIDDGVHQDEVPTSDTEFPFLAPAAAPAKR
jgi:hypothetical protein